MQQNPINDSQDTSEPTTVAQEPVKTATNRRLIIGVAIGLGFLLTVLIILVAILLSQRNSSQQNTQVDTSGSTKSNTQTNSKKGDVVRVVTLEKNPSLQVTIYQPRQTATNTTIDYSVKNICKSGCKSQEYVDSYQLGVIEESSAYLLDDESGTKFNPIVDANNKPLASEPCAGFIEAGKSVECFAAFTRVPNNTAFSFVLRGLKVDNLTAE